MSELTAIQRSLDAITARLDRLESGRTVVHQHPSLEKFAVIEAVADEIFAGLQNEKACTFEPNGKPCDHCSMCSSRGF